LPPAKEAAPLFKGALDKLPVAVLHQDGRRYTDSLVVLRLEDFSNHLSNYLKGGVA
jgi:hypothetical protein